MTSSRSWRKTAPCGSRFTGFRWNEVDRASQVLATLTGDSSDLYDCKGVVDSPPGMSDVNSSVVSRLSYQLFLVWMLIRLLWLCCCNHMAAKLHESGSAVCLYTVIVQNGCSLLWQIISINAGHNCQVYSESFIRKLQLRYGY